MSRYIISHIDLDGFGPDIFYELFNDTLNVDRPFNVDYGFESTGKFDSILTPDNEVIVVDLSFNSEEAYDEWKSKLGKLTVFDHHKASDYLQKDPDNVWDMSRCGTRIFWEDYVRPQVESTTSGKLLKVVDQVVELIDTYDMWKQDSPKWDDAVVLNNTKLRCSAIYGTGAQFPVVMAQRIRQLADEGLDYSNTDAERSLYARVLEEQQRIAAMVFSTLVTRVDNSGLCFAIAPVPKGGNVSSTCDYILKRMQSVDYVIAYSEPYAKHLSFRSDKPDVDLNGLHGVKGHAHSAGGPEWGNPTVRQVGATLKTNNICLKWVQPGENKQDSIVFEECNIPDPGVIS